MVNPDFLKLKKYLTLDEASQHIASHLKNKTVSNKEILLLINEGLVECFYDCPLEPTDESPETDYKIDGAHYKGVGIGLQKVSSKKVRYFYDESQPYGGNVYYIEDGVLEGVFLAYEECAVPHKFFSEKGVEFKKVTHCPYGGLFETENCMFKVESGSLIAALSQLSTTEERPAHTYKGIQQEELILSTLKELGYNPESLPKATSAGGAKAQVKKQLDRRPPFEAKTAFDNAWKVLLSREQIKNS